MGWQHSPKHAFNPQELGELQWVLDSVWSAVEAHYPQRNHANDERLKGALRRKLFSLACAGIEEPDMLRSKLLDGI